MSGVTAATFAPPPTNPMAQKHDFPFNDKVTDGFATASELIVASTSIISVSPPADVSVKHTADFSVPVALTLATTVCCPAGMPDPRK